MPLVNQRLNFMKKICLLLFGICCFVSIHAQNVIDKYIREGLDNNESIKQQTFLLKKNLYALKEAQSLFFPKLIVSGSYNKADGGRTVDFPVGDLLNPIYHSLNELTGSQSFLSLENMAIQLNPDNYYDAKIRLDMPVFNAELLYNRRIKRTAADMQETEILLYKRELVKDIKKAYYQYCQLSKTVEIRKNAVKVASENLRINQSLFKNGKANNTTVLRSENEVTKAEAALFSALQAQKNSQSYFNFLLNKPFESEIQIEEPEIILLSDSTNFSVTDREEMQKLLLASDIKQLNKGLEKSFLLPKVNTFLDLGSQGFDWKVNDQTRYYMLGVSLQWTFSLGGQHIHRINAAKADINALQSQTNHVKEQLELQLQQAINNHQDALSNYASEKSQMDVAEKYFRDMIKLYKEGQVLYIELLDAQTQYVNTSVSLNIARYNVCIKQAEVERANANFNLNNY